MEDTEKKREKFLTAKYGAHQMALIRKRLRVEMWMYDQVRLVMVMEMVMVMVVEMVMVNCHHIINLLCQLQTLYTEEEGAPEVEIDLDEVTLTFCIDLVVITIFRCLTLKMTI